MSAVMGQFGGSHPEGIQVNSRERAGVEALRDAHGVVKTSPDPERVKLLWVI